MEHPQNKPKVASNAPQKTYKSQNIRQQMLEIAQILGNFLIFLLFLLYDIGESIYRTFAPIEPKSVRGEIVLVTGSGHGIGKQLALLYASQGATVVGWDINSENCQQTATEINHLGYPKSYAFVCNVAKRENVIEVAKKVQQQVGNVTILVNNAGIMPTHPILDHSQEEIERIFGINVLAHFWTIQAFLPSMVKNNHGHIVALSSIAGICGLENLVPYCGSKFAVRGMMESLSEELRLANENTKIEFTTVCPYMTNTGLCKKPNIKFEALMPMLEPKLVAQAINEAQRLNKKIVTVPKYMYYLGNYVRLMPYKAIIRFKDLMSSGVESDL